MGLANKRVGIGLDNVVAKSDEQFELWVKLSGIDADSLFCPKLIGDHSFWASMQAFEDFSKFIVDCKANNVDLWVLTERPSTLLPVTVAWLRKQGLQIPVKQIIVSSIKRFDCRIHELDYYIDTKFDLLSTFRYEHTQAICVRSSESEKDNIKVYSDLSNIMEVPYGKVHLPWHNGSLLG